MAQGYKSKFERYEPVAVEYFNKGITVAEVARKFDKIVPRGTIYAWYKKWINKAENIAFKNELDRKTDIADKAIAVDVEVLSDPDKVTLIQGYAQTSDFNKARNTLRRICDDKNEPGAVRVAAARSLLETVKIRAQISQNILDEVAEVKIKNEVDVLSNLSKDELMEKLRDELAS